MVVKNLGSFVMVSCICMACFLPIAQREIYTDSDELCDVIIEIQCENTKVILEQNEPIEINQKYLNFGKDLKNFEDIILFYQDANLSGDCVPDIKQEGLFLVIEKYERTMGSFISCEQNVDINKFFVEKSFDVYPSPERPDKLRLEANYMNLLTSEFQQLRMYNLESYRVSQGERHPADDILHVDTGECRVVSNRGGSFCFSSAQIYIRGMSFNKEFSIDIESFSSLSLKSAQLVFTDPNQIYITSLFINGNRIVGDIDGKVKWGDNGHKKFEISVSDAKIDMGRFTSKNGEKLRIKVRGKMTEKLVPVISIEKKFTIQDENRDISGDFLQTSSNEAIGFRECSIIEIKIDLKNNIDKVLDIHVIDEQEDCGEITKGANSKYFEHLEPDEKENLSYTYKVRLLDSTFSEGEPLTNRITLYYRFAGLDSKFERMIIRTHDTSIVSDPQKADFERRGISEFQLTLFYVNLLCGVIFAIVMFVASLPKIKDNPKKAILASLFIFSFIVLLKIQAPFNYNFRYLSYLFICLLFAFLIYIYRTEIKERIKKLSHS